MTRILILTPNADWITDFEDIDSQLAEFRHAGLEFTTQQWTDHSQLDAHDLILPLMAWGYHQLQNQWLTTMVALSGLPVANPVPVLRWNWDKAYLLDLAARGVAVVPTLSFDALTQSELATARAQFATDDLVIKPPVSGGADGTFLLAAGADAPDVALGKRTLVQPKMPAITSEGEFSLFYFGGVFSHAVLKSPKSGDFRVQPQFGATSAAITPEPAALVLAEAALAAAPAPTTYARVDMVRHGTDFAIMELELIEPHLWLHAAPDQGRLFADAVRSRAG